MNLPEVKTFRLDISGKAKENRVPRETLQPHEMGDGSILVPRYAPFFIESVSVYPVNSNIPLVLNKDYDFVSIDHDLSELTGAAVTWFIRKLKPNLGNLDITYQTLGTVPLLTETTKYWYEAGAEDQRPIWFDQLQNKPQHWLPKLHGHDLRVGFYRFEDMVKVYQDRYETLFGESELIPYRDWFLGQLSNLESYITPFKELLKHYADTHINHKEDPHATKSTAIPGLDRIDNVRTATLDQTLEGTDDQLRVVPVGALEYINNLGPNVSDYKPFATLNPKIVSLNDKLPNFGIEIDVGIKTPNYSVWVDRAGKGEGVGMFYAPKGTVLNWVRNVNPYNRRDVAELNQWVNTHAPFELYDPSGEPEIMDRMIPGGNGRALIVGSSLSKNWFLVDTKNGAESFTWDVTKLIGTEDLEDTWMNYRVMPLKDGVWLTTTADLMSRPKVYVLAMRYQHVANGEVQLVNFKFTYKHLNSFDNKNSNGYIELFARTFDTDGKYLGGDIQLSHPVELVDQPNRIVVMPLELNGELHLEFILAECFRNGKATRRYRHRHLAKVNIHATLNQVSLTWVNRTARPTIDVKTLFGDNPSSLSVYWNEYTVRFPYELCTVYSSLVRLPFEGYMGFGFTDLIQGDTFSTTLIPENYLVRPNGREYHLEGGSEWVEDHRSGVRMVSNTRLDTGHPKGIQPYLGAFVETLDNNVMGLVKGWDRAEGLSWFSKTGLGRVRAVPYDEAYVWSREPNNQIQRLTGLIPDQLVGNYVVARDLEDETDTDNVGNMFLCIGGNTVPRLRVNYPEHLLPLDGNILPEEFITGVYAGVDPSWLTQFGWDDTKFYWHVIMGASEGFPNVLTMDYQKGDKLVTEAIVFTFEPATLDRRDLVLDGSRVVMLTDEDVVTIHSRKEIEHTLPDHIEMVKVKELVPKTHTGVVNVLKTLDGNYNISIAPNNQFGDALDYVTLPVLITVDGKTNEITNGVSESYGRTHGVISLSRARGWSVTSFPNQLDYAGLLNAGEPAEGLYESMMAVLGDTKTKVGLMDIVVQDEWRVFVTSEFYFVIEDRCYLIDRLETNLRDYKPYFGTVNIFGYLGLGPQGPYLITRKGTISGEANEVLVFTAVVSPDGVMSVN